MSCPGAIFVPWRPGQALHWPPVRLVKKTTCRPERVYYARVNPRDIKIICTAWFLFCRNDDPVSVKWCPPMMVEGLVFIVYCRAPKSTRRRGGVSVDAQREEIGNFTGDCAIAEIVEEADQSRFDELLSFGPGHIVVIAHCGPVSRDIDFLERASVLGMSVTVATPHGGRAGALHLVMERARRSQHGARIVAGMAAARQRGAVYGRNGRVLGAENARRSEAVARALQPLIASLPLRKLSLRQIAEILNRRGVVSPGGKAWHAANVRKLLARVDKLVP